MTATVLSFDRPSAAAEAPLKDLYPVGEIPPLGHVPKTMYAWASGANMRPSSPARKNSGSTTRQTMSVA